MTQYSATQLAEKLGYHRASIAKLRERHDIPGAKRLGHIWTYTDESAKFMIDKSNAILAQFKSEWTDAWLPEWKTVPIADGSELSKIYEINANIDVAIALKKEMLRAFGALRPGVIPAGTSPTDMNELKEGAAMAGFVPYAAAGTIVGLGIALAFVVASNKTKRRPGG